MNGIDRNTGKSVSGVDHLRQSIIDILTTPIGSRVMRRDYGSRLYRLVDAPSNQSTLIDIYAATADALIKWESRIDVQSVVASSIQRGKIVLSLTGVYLPNGENVQIEGVEIR